MNDENKNTEEVTQEESFPDEEQETVANESAADQATDEEEVMDVIPEDIKKLKQEAEEWKNRTLRVQADLENVRRRNREERERDAKYRAQDLVQSLLPVVDNFERALQVETESEEAASLLEGVNMVYSQFLDALQSEGVEVIKTEGEPFDPHLHQAVMQVEEDGYESNQIVEELQKGYMLKDKVIRPAMVKVNA